MPPADPISAALATVPPGRWVVGVSGGADSVALLRAIVASRPDVEPIVAHLNHETRGAESDADAEFVAALAGALGVPRVIRRLSEFGPIPERNDEARFRLARRALFTRVAGTRDALGVLLAHHADDRAETTLLRLLRGGEPTVLAGLRADTTLGALRVVRPLLALGGNDLRAFLRSIGQPWREDATNATDRYARNRARAFLSRRPGLTAQLLALADAAVRYAAWLEPRVPVLDDAFACDALADLPAPLARAAARRWLVARGSPGDALSIAVVERLIAMAADHATPHRQAFPGARLVARRRGAIELDRRRAPYGTDVG